MKIGDKLYCIDNYKSGGGLAFRKGVYYKINYIRETSIIDLKSELGYSLGFSTKHFRIGECPSMFYYFIDQKEERKLKIEKLNDNK